MTEHDEQHQHEVEEATAVEVAETVEAEQAESTYEELQAHVAELEGQLKDSELHSLANEQNLRRHHQQGIADTHKFAGQRFAAKMLPVKDYLRMALLDQSGNLDALKVGVQMTLNELQKAFDTTHIKEINPQPGGKLDPHQHQAMQAAVSEQKSNAIVNVMKKDYALADRVLRPVMVVMTRKEG